MTCDFQQIDPIKIAMLLPQGLQYIEMFAGEANCWRAVQTAYPAARIDVNYDTAPHGSPMKQSPMDFLSSAGFASFDCTHRS